MGNTLTVKKKHKWRNRIVGFVLVILASGIYLGNDVNDGAWQDWAVDIVNPVPAITAPVSKGKPPAGLNSEQLTYATSILNVGHKLRLPRQAIVVAFVTVFQESQFHNYYNTKYLETKTYPGADKPPYEDHDSVGLFQQRPSMGWCDGKPNNCMDPVFAATKFYRKLRKIKGWENMPVTVAAQKVQRSGYPDRYAQHEAKARALVNYICGDRC